VQGGLRRGVLGHVGGLAGVRAALVVRPGRLLGRKARQLDLDLRAREGMGDALVGADRAAPDPALGRVAGGLGKGVPGDPVGAGRADDALGVQALEDLAKAERKAAAS